MIKYGWNARQSFWMALFYLLAYLIICNLINLLKECHYCAEYQLQNEGQLFWKQRACKGSNYSIAVGLIAIILSVSSACPVDIAQSPLSGTLCLNTILLMKHMTTRWRAAHSSLVAKVCFMKDWICQALLNCAFVNYFSAVIGFHSLLRQVLKPN